MEPGVHTPLLESSNGSTDIEEEGTQWTRLAAPQVSSSSLRHRSSSFHRTKSHNVAAERTLGVLAVCFVTYFNVCGGPWGTELIISSAGPLPGLLGIILISLCYSLPLSLITAELASAYPDDGGYSIWVAEAYGEFWGFQESYWSWVSGVIDNAVYPVLAYETLVKLFGPEHFLRAVSPYLVKLGLLFLFTLPNLFTVRQFGNGLGLLAIIVFLPFFLMVLNVFVPFDGHGEPHNWAVLSEIKDDLSLGDVMNLITILYWNFSGFDCISTCAGEVKEPAKSYSRGLVLALLLVLVTYYLPLVSFTIVDNPRWQSWDEGSFETIAKVQVGHWMAVWIVVCSCLGNAGMHAAEMFEDSWQLCGMAESGLAPKVFASRHARFKTPWAAIWFSVLIIAAIIFLDFISILVFTNFFSIISVLLEILAFLKLRLVKPELERPYKIPIHSNGGIVVFLILPSAIATLILLTALFNTLLVFVLNIAALVFGIGLYWLMKRRGGIDYAYNGQRNSNESLYHSHIT